MFLLQRHYKAFHPVCNLLLAWKWDQTQKAKHLKKITQTKTAMRIAPPKAYQHLHVKLKKIQMEEGSINGLT
jgi:hypothetical protein